MLCYTAERLVADVGMESLIAFDLTLPTPALEVLQTYKTVQVDRIEPAAGSLLVEGRLRAVYTILGAPDQTGWGTVQGLARDLPFVGSITQAGIATGMAVRPLAAHTLSQVLTITGRSEAGLLLSLADRTLIWVALRVTTPVDLMLPAPSSQRVAPAASGRFASQSILARRETTR